MRQRVDGRNIRASVTSTRRESGFTLIEVVVAMVIIAMAATTLVGVMSGIANRSAVAMQQAQAVSVADAYLRQFLARPFADMTGANDLGARDQFGNAIAGLANYQVTVAVVARALGTVPAAQARQVMVTVVAPDQSRIIMSGYKTEHP